MFMYIYSMRIVIKNVETGSTMNNDNGTSIIHYRITSNDGEMFMVWLPSTIPTPQINQSYDLEFVGEKTWKWVDDKYPRIYKKVKMKKVNTSSNDEHNPFTTTPVQSKPQMNINTPPTQIYSTGTEHEYHKMAMDYLFRVGNTDLEAIMKLSPHMKNIMTGTISQDKLYQLLDELNLYGVS